MAHENDGWREEVDYVHEAWPSRMTKLPFRKPPKNLGENPNIYTFKKGKDMDEETAELEAMYGLGREDDDDDRGGRRQQQRRRRSGAQFLSMEAAEAGGSSDEEESQSESSSSEDEEEGDPVDRVRGEVGPSRPKRSHEERQRPVPSALRKFIDVYITPRYYGYTFLSHNSSGFDGILLLEALLKSHIVVETIFDAGRLLQLSVPKLKINFIDSCR